MRGSLTPKPYLFWCGFLFEKLLLKSNRLQYIQIESAWAIVHYNNHGKTHRLPSFPGNTFLSRELGGTVRAVLRITAVHERMDKETK
jgi:hypothetical protein